MIKIQLKNVKLMIKVKVMKNDNNNNNQNNFIKNNRILLLI